MKTGEWLYLCVAYGSMVYNTTSTKDLTCCNEECILHTVNSSTALLKSPRTFPSWPPSSLHNLYIPFQIPVASHKHFPHNPVVWDVSLHMPTIAARPKHRLLSWCSLIEVPFCFGEDEDITCPGWGYLLGRMHTCMGLTGDDVDASDERDSDVAKGEWWL